MKAVIFARISTQEQKTDIDSTEDQFTKLREYCKANDIEVIKEIIGKVNLADIDFSEQTVVLGVKLDLGIDFKYVDSDSLEYLHPKREQQDNILLCGLDWYYQLFSQGYPQQHKYRFLDIIEYTLAEESLVLKNRFTQITSSNEDAAFDEGVNLARKANPDWSIELVWGFNLLERLVQRKLNNSTNKGKLLYESLLKNESFKKYLENHLRDSGNDDYYFALCAMERTMGDNYRNIMAHDLFIECLSMKDANLQGDNSQYAMWQLFSNGFWSDINKIRELYKFIQKWNNQS